MEEHKQNKENKILVVDDEITILRLLKINLSKNGYAVQTASNGKEALQIIEKEPDFDLVLLDVMMPEMSGYQVCRKLREKFTLYELPIMFVTAKFQVHDIIEGFDLGGNDYVLKPFEFKELLARTKTLVNLKKLTKSNERLQTVKEITEKFHQMTIHDLKNPLTSILIRSEFIQNQINKDSEFIEHIDAIRKMAKVMTSLIEDFEEISKIESGRISVVKEKITMNKLVEGIINQNKANVEKKEQKVIFNPAPKNQDFIHADESKISRVVDNLLSNAIKFSPVAEKIIIVIEIDEEGTHPKLIFSIKDNGQGLTEEDKQNVFNKFQKLSARPTAGEPSSGLGLSIAKEFINMHDGTIWVESEESKGATFFFKLDRWSEENQM